MSEIAFFVPGIPKGQPRARACIRGRHAGIYNPATADDWKSAVYDSAKRFAPQSPEAGPVCVDLTFYFPRPKGHYRTGRRTHELRPDAPKFHTSKPDRDNSDKAVLDSLSQLGFWKDDAQVCDGRIQKLYGARTGVEIVIRNAEPSSGK